MFRPYRSGVPPMLNMVMPTPSLPLRPSRSKEQQALKAAFATNDLRRICRAIDAVASENGFAKVAEEAKVDRTTIYRAFRRENGPALDTMVRVLRVLGLRLIVTMKPDPSSKRLRPDAKTTARSLTSAFRSGDLDSAIEVLARVLRSQENVSEFVRTTAVSRENLYRSFAFPRIPRFRTVLSFLNALGLQFGVERSPEVGSGIALRGKVGSQMSRNDRPARRTHSAGGRNISRKGRAKNCTA